MKNKKLLPCPFCGGEAEIAPIDGDGCVYDDDYEFGPLEEIWFSIIHDEEKNPECPVTHYTGAHLGTWMWDTQEEAIDFWNKRI